MGKGKNILINGKTGDEWLKIAKKRGVVNQGWYAADIPQAVESGIKASWEQGINQLSQQNYAFRLNKAVGSAIENNARFAHFLDKIKNGSTVDEAVMSVKKYLFDYEDLTSFEKNVMKRVFPFYTWTRKNIPLQLENLIKQPGKYAGMEKVIRAIESLSMRDTEPANEKYLSDYIKNNTAMRVGYNEKTKTYNYFLLGMWLPSYQAMDFLAQPKENIVAMVTPLLKTPMEVWANKSEFFRNSLGDSSLIEKYEGDTVNYLGYSMPAKVATVIRNIRLLNELDKLNPGKIFGGVKGEPSKMPRIGNLAIPSTKRYSSPSLEPSAGERVASTFLGKYQQYNEPLSAYYYNKDTQNKITEIETAIKDAQKNGEKERVKILVEKLKKFQKERSK
jgi:hypothetical protein